MPPTRDQVLADSTRVAQEAAKMIGGTFTQGVGFKQNVPVSVMENPQQPLTIPQPQLDPTPAMQTALGGTQPLLEQRTAQAQAELDAQKTTTTANDQEIQKLFGIMGQAPTVQKQFEDQAGLAAKTDIANRISAQMGLVQNNQQLFNLQTDPMSYANQLEASTRDITKGTFSAMDSRMRVERALESNRMSAELVGLRAQYEVADGQVKAAERSVAQAMDIFYTPIKQELEMQKMFFQRNERAMSEAQSKLARAEEKQIDRQLKEIDDAKDMVSSAVASGYASAEDIEMMTSLSGDPAQQRAAAQKIVAKGAREMMVLERMAKNASIAASATTRRANLVELAIAGDTAAITELGFDPGQPIREAKEAEEATAKAQEDIVLDKQIESQSTLVDNLTKALGMEQGLKASSGEWQFGEATISGIFASSGEELEIGGKTLAPQGISGAIKARAQKQEFLGLMNNLLLGEGFKQFGKLKDEGVNLTPVSEFEFQKVMESSNYLNSVSIVKNGQLQGFKVSDAVVKREIATMIEGANKIMAEKAAIKELGYDGYVELMQLRANMQ
jgi:hypothetical protein